MLPGFEAEDNRLGAEILDGCAEDVFGVLLLIDYVFLVVVGIDVTSAEDL